MLFNKNKNPFLLMTSLMSIKNPNLHFTYRKLTKNITIYQNTIIKSNQYALNNKNFEIGIRKLLTMQHQYFKSHPDFTTHYFTTLTENRSVYLNKQNESSKYLVPSQKEFDQWENKFDEYDNKIRKIQETINDLLVSKEIKHIKPILLQEKEVLQKGQAMIRKYMRYESYRKGNL